VVGSRISATTMTCFPAAMCACFASTAEFALETNSSAIPARLSFEAEVRGAAAVHEGQ